MSERDHDEDVLIETPSPAGRISPRAQIILIAVGIGLFNALLIGVLVYVFVVY